MEPVIQRLIREWKEAQEAHLVARDAYRVAWSKAYLASQQKTDTARKAEADIATSEQRLARDRAETAAAAAWQTMLAERGRLESAGQPGRPGEEAA